MTTVAFGAELVLDAAEVALVDAVGVDEAVDVFEPADARDPAERVLGFAVFARLDEVDFVRVLVFASNVVV
jgi:hypothetical protein